MHEKLITALNDDSLIKIQGLAIMRKERIVIPTGGGELVPVVMSDNITCYVRSAQRGKETPVQKECAGMNNVSEQMILVFFQMKEKYVMESVYRYLRKRIKIAGGEVGDWYMDKEAILNEEKLQNSQGQYLKILFTYEYLSSFTECDTLECVC